MRLLKSNEIENRLSNQGNLLNRFTFFNKPISGAVAVRTIKNGKMIHHSSTSGHIPSLGSTLRKIVALTAIDSDSVQTAEAFDLHPDHVRSLATGVNGKSKGKDEELSALIESHKKKIGLSALETTMQSFGLISQEKLNKLDPKELADVAVKSATVFEKMQPKTSSGNNVQVVVYTPPQRQEKEYNVVEVVDAEVN